MVQACLERLQNLRGLDVTSVFERSASVPGTIYVETNELSDVLATVKDLSGVAVNPKIELVDPQDKQALIDLGRSLVETRSWVRVGRGGMYRNDLGYVIDIDSDNELATVLLVPRIIVKPTRRSRKGKERQVSRTIRPPPLVFNPRTSSLPYEELDHQRVKWNRKVFRGGLEEKVLPTSRLYPSSPRAAELLMFVQGQAIEASVLKSALSECAASSLKPGSAVRIVAGEQAGMVGRLDDISHGVARVLPDHDKHGAVQVPITVLCLRLHVGDYIRVSAGENVGRMGWITEIESEDGMDLVTFTDDTLEIQEEVSPS